VKRQPKPHPTEPIQFPRADHAALARFDPSTATCTMNCGPHRQDPRTAAERRFLCGDCLKAPAARDTEGPAGTTGCACVSRDARQCADMRYSGDAEGYLCQCMCHEWEDGDA